MSPESIKGIRTVLKRSMRQKACVVCIGVLSFLCSFIDFFKIPWIVFGVLWSSLEFFGVPVVSKSLIEHEKSWHPMLTRWLYGCKFMQYFDSSQPQKELMRYSAHFKVTSIDFDSYEL